MEKMASRYHKLSVEKSRIEKELNDIKSQLRKIVAPDSVTHVGEYNISRQTVIVHRFDDKAFSVDHPEYALKYTKETFQDRLVVK